MLKLVADNPETNNDELAGEHVRQHAPAFAADVIRYILHQASYDNLVNSSQNQFMDWWQLSISGGPSEDDYESVYWYLLYLIESRREDELRGNRFVNQRLKECACYLINKEKLPRFARGIRP
ncbi:MULTISPECIES: hypothetical protein [Grimontia]|uniref:Uncharacterized protein n=1 Tax=Grimontia marina TaxID=646534 RepID=A0A128F4E4_9GAMM|nr:MULTISPECIES: hypothetical protein [Grimontia]WRV99200.1 hypothetical protein VP504_07315 [Grimontia sp. NTOU-MAR1]CZF81653.1 hypothetical protein GMA8713_01924 [Grimontia marina]